MRERSSRTRSRGRPRAARAGRPPPRRRAPAPRGTPRTSADDVARSAGAACMVAGVAPHVHQDEPRAVPRPRRGAGAGSCVPALTSFTKVAPGARARRRRRTALRVSTLRWGRRTPARRSARDHRHDPRRLLLGRGTSAAPGRVLSPPTSSTSAPSPARREARGRPPPRRGVPPAVGERVGRDVDDPQTTGRCRTGGLAARGGAATADPGARAQYAKPRRASRRRADRPRRGRGAGGPRPLRARASRAGGPRGVRSTSSPRRSADLVAVERLVLEERLRRPGGGRRGAPRSVGAVSA